MRKSILMGLGLTVALAGTAVAQQGGHEGHGTKQQQDTARGRRFGMRGGAPDAFLLRGITLTEAQKTQLQTLRTSQREQMKTSREASRKERMEARQQRVAAIRNILTAEQRVQFDKNLAELKERRTDRRQAKGH